MIQLCTLVIGAGLVGLALQALAALPSPVLVAGAMVALGSGLLACLLTAEVRRMGLLYYAPSALQRLMLDVCVGARAPRFAD